MPVKDELLARAGRVHDYLSGSLDGRDVPPKLRRAMEYSLLAGGKRLRPVLCLCWSGIFGEPEERVMPFASSLEYIHTYSLVHDDLPAMDDDDLRRGKPSNHKAHGEALAILAGDGLLTEAFTLASSVPLPAERVLPAVSLLALAAGAEGMVGGQALDMEYTGKPKVDLAELKGMHARKTGALIRVACEAGAVLGGADAQGRAKAREYGVLMGAAFQIVDDVLDVVGDEAELGKPVGSDEGKDKHTYPRLLGLEESRKLAQTYVDKAAGICEGFPGDDAAFLGRLARYMTQRVN
ncbi:polyprenyl synthetase family protein [Desulfohalovibrio reitneri]|uniref:polyprenyl synthetase family protein n=1 Tax=Desulfohalovibrio reitneri TaxID=1307759 RepID=UPI0004A6E684|nr:farnesyl diphosphate synthase [Desulfohalovibrio reitneri]